MLVLHVYFAHESNKPERVCMCQQAAAPHAGPTSAFATATAVAPSAFDAMVVNSFYRALGCIRTAWVS